MKKTVLALLIGSMIFAPLCAGGNQEKQMADKAAVQEKTEILISAAASLKNAIQELSGMYESQNPQVKITANFGSSGALQRQIEQGAPADIFFSAGIRQMNALKEKGLMLDSSVKNILKNRLVLIVPKGSAGVPSFEALTGDAVQKIAVGEPKSVPVGQYSQQVFKSLGLTDAVTPKLIFAKDVREVLSWVETGNVDVGIVYHSDVKRSDKVQACAVAAEESHDPIIYPIGVIKDSKQQTEAQKFVDFLFSDAAKTVFEKYDFSAL
ncbi:MAG: molybdate ABC transporter substrate-binding protein [Treponema sp.]